MKNYILLIFIVVISVALLLSISQVIENFKQEPKECEYIQNEIPIFNSPEKITSEDMAEFVLENYLQKNAAFEETKLQQCGIAYIFSILDENDDKKYIVCTNEKVYVAEKKCSSGFI